MPMCVALFSGAETCFDRQPLRTPIGSQQDSYVVLFHQGQGQETQVPDKKLFSSVLPLRNDIWGTFLLCVWEPSSS